MPEHIGTTLNKAMNRLRAQAQKRSKEMEKPKKVYTIVKNTNGGKDYWLEIGIAFTNKDGSLNVKLNAFPVNGTLHIRETKSNN